MKPLHTLLSLVSLAVAFVVFGSSLAAAAPVSDDVLLSAIATVETGNNPSRLGHYGERTQLQILPQTWRRFSRLPHTQAASHPAETERVARAYLASIRERLKERGLPETPFYMAAAWNAGPAWRRLSPHTVSYARRVANLVEIADREERPAVADVKPAPEPAKPALVVDISRPAAAPLFEGLRGTAGRPTVSFALPAITAEGVAVPFVAKAVPPQRVPVISLDDPAPEASLATRQAPLIALVGLPN